ncbi:uncharacterized protein LOC119067744 [Bradysia coprophila]|uniref:uncharacterized protein LOC119067744 n=1 Tax=Bradysia coprophila TaxID=38358 RepID=UPI00187D8059|nr:uncharacterized protein LOC119067744 [Bradysia coprophila]
MEKQIKLTCSIASSEDESSVQNEIGKSGNSLIELKLEVADKYWKYWLDGINFLDRVLRNCPKLQTLCISSDISPNLLFGIVCNTQQQLKHLTICSKRHRNDGEERVKKSEAVDLSSGLKRLQSFDVQGVDWNRTIICNFLRKAKKLKHFACEIIGTDFNLDEDFLDDFKLSEAEEQEQMLHELIAEEIYCDTYEGEADFWGQE